MIVIYKYECVPGVLDWVVQMHQGAEILTLGTQNHNFVYWAKVDPKMPQVPRRLRLIMTAQPIEDMPDAKYCGTCNSSVEGIPFVLHLFDLDEVLRGNS